MSDIYHLMIIRDWLYPNNTFDEVRDLLVKFPNTGTYVEDPNSGRRVIQVPKIEQCMTFTPTEEEMIAMCNGWVGNPTVATKPTWSWPHVPTPVQTSEDDWVYTPDPHYCKHSWVNTGSRRTWCKKCDSDGDLDPMTGSVTITARVKPTKDNVIKGED